MSKYEPTWRPKEGELNVVYGTFDIVKKIRCNPEGPVHFVYIMEEEK